MTSSKLLEIERSILNLSSEEKKLLLDWMTQQVQSLRGENAEINLDSPPTQAEIKDAQRIIQSVIEEVINSPEKDYEKIWNEFDLARSRLQKAQQR